jgi:hypothetical protein
MYIYIYIHTHFKPEKLIINTVYARTIVGSVLNLTSRTNTVFRLFYATAKCLMKKDVAQRVVFQSEGCACGNVVRIIPLVNIMKLFVF